MTELKYDATSLIYSSYLSGKGTDVASGMTIDTAGFIYVTGTTTSNDVASFSDQFPASTLPQALPYQISPRAAIQFFVTKVNTAAGGPSSIAYSTYFGGANFDTTTPIAVGGSIAVDNPGRNIYFTGTTNFLYNGCAGCSNTDFPILNPYQPCLDQVPPTIIVTAPQCTYPTGAPPPSESDAFVAKLNPNVGQGLQLVWSTYLGGGNKYGDGDGNDSGVGIALDPGAANVYVTGTTNSYRHRDERNHNQHLLRVSTLSRYSGEPCIVDHTMSAALNESYRDRCVRGAPDQSFHDRHNHHCE